MVLSIPCLAENQDTTKTAEIQYPLLKPIVQVFGAAQYNHSGNHYSYGFGRAHLGFKYDFNQSWSSQIILDRGRPSSMGEIFVTDSIGSALNVSSSSREGAYYSMFLKFASLKWKVNQKLSIEGGALLQNHYITQERFWDLRYVAQTFQDMYWKIPSSDLGFMARYRINRHISFDVALTNGEGPRIQQDEFGKVKMAAGIDITPNDHIQTRFYYHNQPSEIPGSATENMFSFFAGTKQDNKLRIGAEYNHMLNFQNTSGLKVYGYSIYGAWGFLRNIELFARFDQLIYQRESVLTQDILESGSALITGLSLNPIEGIFGSVNYQLWIPEGSPTRTQHRFLFSMEYKF